MRTKTNEFIGRCPVGCCGESGRAGLVYVELDTRFGLPFLEARCDVCDELAGVDVALAPLRFGFKRQYGKWWERIIAAVRSYFWYGY